MKKLFFGLWLVSFSIGATSFNDGLEAYNQEDFQRAHDIWKSLVDNDSQFSKELGTENISVDDKAFAQYAIGMMYWHGQQVEQSYAYAFHWLLLAAENGHKEAAFNLANLYIDGLTGLKSLNKGAEWMTVAAKSGLPEAQYRLGVMLFDGNGVAMDKQQAVYWLRQAEAGGIEDAGQMLADLEADGLIEAPEVGQMNVANNSGIAEGVQEDRSTDKPSATVDEEIEPRAMDTSADGANAVSANPNETPLEDSLLPYAIQIVATNNLARAESLAKRYRSEVALTIFRKRVKQQELYVVLDCCFQTRTEAGTRLIALPAELQANKPFIIATSDVSRM